MSNSANSSEIDCVFFALGVGCLQHKDQQVLSDVEHQMCRRQVQSGIRHCQDPAPGHPARSHCRQEGRKGHQDRERRKAGGQERDFPRLHRQWRSHRSSQ